MRLRTGTQVRICSGGVAAAGTKGGRRAGVGEAAAGEWTGIHHGPGGSVQPVDPGPGSRRGGNGGDAAGALRVGQPGGCGGVGRRLHDRRLRGCRVVAVHLGTHPRRHRRHGRLGGRCVVGDGTGS